MPDFHAEDYPNLKKAMIEIGQSLSKPDFQINVYSLTKAKARVYIISTV